MTTQIAQKIEMLSDNTIQDISASYEWRQSHALHKLGMLGSKGEQMRNTCLESRVAGDGNDRAVLHEAASTVRLAHGLERLVVAQSHLDSLLVGQNDGHSFLWHKGQSGVMSTLDNCRCSARHKAIFAMSTHS